jgi:N-acetylglucosaminyldiphosphoundecaprenol N-acetyl-beta-D-mannosaminyltransferase
MDPELPRRAFLGIDFAAIGPAEALRWVREAAAGDGFRYVVTPNVDHVVMLHKTGGEAWRESYRAAVARADLVVNDSRILARLADLADVDLPVVPGSDLTRALIESGLEPCDGVVLIGGSPAEAAWLEAALPKARIFHFEPPMGVRDRPELHDRIAAFVERQDAAYVLLAIGAPQSEIVAHRIAERGKARGVALCIGASVEFLSGARRRAPRWMQSLGLEWAFRLLSEPRRLWRRYLVEGPRIFAIWLHWRRGAGALTSPPP